MQTFMITRGTLFRSPARSVLPAQRWMSVQCALKRDGHGTKTLNISSSEPKWAEFNNQTYTVDKPGWINIEQRDENVRVGIPANAALELAFSQKDIVKSIAFKNQIQLARLDRNSGELELSGRDGNVTCQLADKCVPSFQAILRRQVLVAHGFDPSIQDKAAQTASITIWGENQSFGRIAVGSNGYIKFDVRENGRMAKFTGIVVHPVASLLRDSGCWMDGTIRVEGFPPYNAAEGSPPCFVEVSEDSFMDADEEGPCYTLTVGSDGSALSKKLLPHEFAAFEEVIRFYINRVVDEDCASSALFRAQSASGGGSTWKKPTQTKPKVATTEQSDFAAHHILD